MTPFRTGPWLLWLLAVGAVPPALGATRMVDVSEELRRLMTQYGFQVSSDHLALTRDIQGRAEGAELLPRLNALLEGFDYVIVQGPTGVERILILGLKAAYTPPPTPAPPAPPPAAAAPPADRSQGEATPKAEIVLESQRKGTSHTLTLGLEGLGGQRIQQSLLLDTGADFVVLPASLIARLGIPAGGLRTQRVQTANGPIDARIGRLAALWLGGSRLPGIETAFIDDTKLGNTGLLGMSVLGRFRVTIDDAQNRVVLSGN